MRRRTREDIIIDTINSVLMIGVLFVTLYPFWYILIYSFNEGIDSGASGLYLYPRQFTLENYRAFFTDGKWIRSLFVSVARTGIGSTITVFFTCLVAFGLSHKHLRFRKAYFAIVIFSMYFSGGIITYYVLLRSLGLIDRFLVYIIPNALNKFFIVVAAAFIGEIPDEMRESAHMDGAREFTIFVKIIVPVSMPLIATMFLFVGVAQWNSWLDSAYFVRSESLRTISYRMIEVTNTTLSQYNAQTSIYAERVSQVTTRSLQMASMVVATFPIMCVYPFLQKHFVKGVMVGAIKG